MYDPTPEISVVIPAHNAERHITDALESVFAQTCRDFEVIVVDDGSTDDTSTIVARRFPDVRCYCTRNRGVSAARNFGISVSRGRLIAFLDADDLWLPEKLEKQAACFDDDSVGLVFTENLLLRSDGMSDRGFGKRERLMEGDIVRNIFLNSYVVTSTVMVRRTVLNRVGLFDEQLAVGEDDNLWMRIAASHSVRMIDEPLTAYRLTEGSLSRTRRNIMPAIKKHIALLESRYPEVYRRIGPGAVRLKLNDLYFSEAYHRFSLCRYREARTLFLRSFGFCPLKPKPLLYALSTCLPDLLIKAIREWKQRTERPKGSGGALDLAHKGCNR